MYCDHCGNKLEPNDNFCESCGTPTKHESTPTSNITAPQPQPAPTSPRKMEKSTIFLALTIIFYTIAGMFFLLCLLFPIFIEIFGAILVFVTFGLLLLDEGFANLMNSPGEYFDKYLNTNLAIVGIWVVLATVFLTVYLIRRNRIKNGTLQETFLPRGITIFGIVMLGIIAAIISTIALFALA